MPYPNTPNSDGEPIEPTTPPSQHVNADCRARPSGVGSFVDCLMGQPLHCQHGLSFGYGIFCRHPERERIVAQTEANPPA
ncbi:MAG: hypothetical protein WCJ14_05175 [Verrucomicrobiota bacterium]